jgi:hypothetical protein
MFLAGSNLVESHNCKLRWRLTQPAFFRGWDYSSRPRNRAGIAQGLNVVKVCVVSTPIEHSAKMSDFQKWIAREGGSPREHTDRRRIREILGVTSTR